MDTTHNHPPRCCCQIGRGTPTSTTTGVIRCPLCPEHGELAQLAQPQPGECPICHSEIGKQHTDYCRFDGVVSVLPVGAFATGIGQTSQRPASWTTPNCPMDCTHDHSDVIGQTSQPATRTSQAMTHNRFGKPLPGQWLHYESDPNRIEHRSALGGSWHDHTSCTLETCGATPADAKPQSIHIPIRSTDRWPDHPITQCSPELCGEPTSQPGTFTNVLGRPGLGPGWSHLHADGQRWYHLEGHDCDEGNGMPEPTNQARSCTCGTTYATYEGPQRDCPRHGEPDTQIRDAADDIDVTTTRNPICTCTGFTTVRSWFAPSFHRDGCPAGRRDSEATPLAEHTPLAGPECLASVDGWCRTCSTSAGPIYHPRVE